MENAKCSRTYIFFDKMEKELFILLIGVSGVGASTARMMLSSMHPDEINKAIADKASDADVLGHHGR